MIELIFVVAILGILTSVAIPKLKGVAKEAEERKQEKQQQPSENAGSEYK